MLPPISAWTIPFSTPFGFLITKTCSESFTSNSQAPKLRDLLPKPILPSGSTVPTRNEFPKMGRPLATWTSKKFGAINGQPRMA
jgi:hypothetical protein